MNEMTKLKDFYGNLLKQGIYFAGDGKEGNFYFIEIYREGEELLAKSCKGSIPIENSESFAKQLIPLANPCNNLEFAIIKTLDTSFMTKT